MTTNLTFYNDLQTVGLIHPLEVRQRGTTSFERKALRVLDLYHGEWEGNPLSPSDCILSTDEKTSIQVLKRPCGNPSLALLLNPSGLCGRMPPGWGAVSICVDAPSRATYMTTAIVVTSTCTVD